ncbi:MAG TPA: hypothetical protein VNO87_12550 [Methylomirabilota bacterium]|nr:hypothetical protein [Methylomirabilota bacterium]
MRLATALAAGLAVVALAGCETSSPPSTPTRLPAADLTVTDPKDDQGLFYMAPDQTLLLMMGNASSLDSNVLAVARHYPNATLFKGKAVGRTTVLGFDTTHCASECNTRGPLTITVVVVSAIDLQNGVIVSEQDKPWVIRLHTGQPFVITLRNPPGGPPWARLTSANQTIIVPLQTAVLSADGIQQRFRADGPGRGAVYAVGPGCPSGACPEAPYIGFTFLVFV